MPSAQKVFIGIETKMVFGREYLRGISAFQSAHGFWDCRLNPWHPHLLPQDAEHFNGAIMRIRDLKEAEPFLRRGIPVINLSASSPSPLALPTLMVDQKAVGQKAASHFLDRGFQSFGYLGVREQYYSEQRYLGYAESIKASGLLPAKPYLFYGDILKKESSLVDYVLQLPKPLAMFCGSDLYAFYLLELLQEAHVECPDDVAILGVDNDPYICQFSNPQLSSINPASYSTGFQAAAWLQQLMEHGFSKNETLLKTIPPGEVDVRQSTSVYAVPDAALQSALTLIRKELHTPLRVSDLATYSGVSRKSLELKFQRYLQHSPAEEIRRRRMEEARRLLLQTELPMSQIAERCGLPSQSALSSLFKKYQGCSPRSYRKKDQLILNAKTSGGGS